MKSITFWTASKEMCKRHGTFLDVDGKVLDGTAKVHFMVPGTCGTFEDYVKEVFVPYVMKELDTVI